ncbi:hypothetical protein ACFP56_11190 [Paenibacillus septentrionalis]|uniref:Glycosyltransferase RgtA/B/C/D-like domain-containing protein n=1 Tax=Paenibacillus septentrionalis TaxID=429342 RepID=A0ABW1V6V8_9BACL
MKYKIRFELIYILAAAGLIISLLLTGVFIGVADNGDFLRIMGSIGLNDYDPQESYEDRYFYFAHSTFAYDTFFRGFYPSTQLIIVVIARMIAGLFNSSYFDIRFLGAIYGLLLITANVLLIKAYRYKGLLASIVLTALLLVVFHDIGYLAYFNSLYGEPVSFIFLLLTMALSLLLLHKEKPTKAMLVWVFAACLFLVCSKTQNAPIGLGFAFLFWRYAALHKENREWRRLALSLGIALVVISAASYIFAPKDFKQINLYQTVFFGILHQSPDVEGDLEELGLPGELSVLAGTNYFQTDTAIKQDDPMLQDAFYNRISHADVALFYLKHPGRLLANAAYAAEHSMNIRPYYLGNYEKSEGKPPGTVTFQYSAWSEFKRNILPNQLWFIVFVYVLYYGGALYEWIAARSLRSKLQSELFMVLGLVGLIGYFVPIVGDGMADLSKHLFMFNVVFDMMLVASVMWVIVKLSRFSYRS